MGIRPRAILAILAIAFAYWTVPAQVHAQASSNALPVEIVPLVGHAEAVNEVAVSPNGQRVLSGSADNMKLWDVASGRLIRTFIGDGWASVAFSPDGQQVLSGHLDHTLKLWDAATARLIRTFTGHSKLVFSVAFSPDGTHVLSGSEDHTLKLWDVATGRLIRTFEGHSDGVKSVAFSPDGKNVLSGSGFDDKTLKLWDVATGRLIRIFEGHGHTVNSVDSVAFSPDGRHVLSGNWDNTLKLWDVATGRLIRTFEGHGNSVSSVAFSLDGHHVVSGSEDHTLKLWDVATGRLIRTFEGHGNSVSSVAFSLDGHHVVSGSRDHTLKLWDVATGKLIRTFKGQDSGVRSATFSPDGKHTLSGHFDHTLKLWDAATGRLIRTFIGHSDEVQSVAFSPDGRKGLSGSGSNDKTLKLWDVATGSLIRTFVGHGLGVYSVAFSPDGRHVLSGSGDNTLKLWDAATGRLIRTIDGHSNQVLAAAFSPDGRTVLSGSIDDTMKLWDVATGRLIRVFEGHGEAVSSVAFSPDGHHVLSGSWDHTLKLWDVATGGLIRTFEGHSAQVDSVAVSPDGHHALSGSVDKTLKLWDAATGSLIRTFDAHSRTNEVAFSPDGARALVGLAQGTTEVRRAETGELLASFIALPDAEWVTITPEGFFDASANGASAVTVVRGLEVYSVGQVYQALYRPDLVREKLAGDPQGKVREAAARLDLAKVIASGGAPCVTITAPKSGASVAEEQINFEATVTDQGGGVGKVEWRVNGVTLGVEQRGLGPEDSSAKMLSMRRQLTLEPGDNRIEIIAYNAKGLIASEPARIAVKWTGEKASAPPRLYALAVGVNDYWDSRLRLNFAAPDAKAIGEALRRAGASLYERVQVTTVIDADATNANLDRVFNDLAKQVRPRDVFVFFLAGHGKTIDGRYYFLPYDFRYQSEDSFTSKGVGQDRFQEWFARIPARKSVLLYDTCESGSLTGERVALRGVERITALEKMTRAMGRTVLSASTDDTPALEGYRGHGVFTYVALEALGLAHANTEGLISVTDLAAYIDERVPELSNAVFKMRQVPQMNIVGSNFPLVRKTAVLPAAPAAIGAPSIQGKPTHVVVTMSPVRQSANPDAPVIMQLTAGTQVQLVETARGWVFVAKDGRNLGYLQEKDLARLQ